jgi:hypothetical protein
MVSWEDIVKLVFIVAMWVFYGFLVWFSNAMSIPIWTIGGILLLLGFFALAIIFGILTFALLA